MKLVAISLYAMDASKMFSIELNAKNAIDKANGKEEITEN